MADTLGILVTTDNHLDAVIQFVNAAHGKGKEVQAFFTGAAVHLTLQPDFAKLEGKAKLWICDVSFRGNGYHGREDEVPGLRHPGPQCRDAGRDGPLRGVLMTPFSL